MHLRYCLASVALVACLPSSGLAQEAPRWYGGAMLGVSALSADAEHLATGGDLAVSLYKPENGPAVNGFAGVHLTDYLSVQANYIWNRNDLTLLSSRAEGGTTAFYEQARRSAQHAVIGDLLLYFRDRSSRFRPYLSAGGGVVRLSSHARGSALVVGIEPPEDEFTDIHPVLRVAVGIDVRIESRWSLRYSFSETLSQNSISQRLTPAGSRSLANFQNLVGVVRTF